MDRLAGVFTESVRARALDLTGRGKIELVEDSETVLLATVTGSEKYLTGFRRSKGVLYYGCTCPFFTEEGVGCKHQWALVREAPESAVVRGAGDCTALVASSHCLHGEPDPASLPTPAPDDQESLTAQLARSLLMRAGQRR